MTAPTVEATKAAEEAVIGACLLEPRAIRAASEHVTADDFSNFNLGAIFDAMLAAHSAGQPIDAVTVLALVTEAGVRGVDGVMLHDLVTATPTAANVGYYARQVAEGATRRRLWQFGARTQQIATAGEALTDIMTTVRSEWDAIRSTGSTQIEARTLNDVLDGVDDYDWLIPQLLERQDRLVLTGGEGAGKSTFVRQLAICAAAGIHPTTFASIKPVRTLVVDAENSEKQWRRAARPLVLRARQVGRTDPGSALRLACVPRLDISTERDLGAVHRLVDQHKPDLLVIGPLYRLIPRAINSDDDAAPLLAALDSLRARGLALVMEAHAGHAMTAGGQRDLRPRGSSALMGWPEFGLGLALDRDDPSLAHMLRWRGDRDERAWPTDLRRGGDWPWTDNRIAYGLGPRWTPRHGEDAA